jgi:superfamily II DNA helicase RecQ
MLCLSLEQLISKGFCDLLEHKPFWNQFCALRVDEIHLLYLWGTSFRLVFQQIEFIRLQCPPWIVTMGLSATVAKGRVMDYVCKFLGYRPGKFHIIRRSNARYDVQLIIRELQNGLGGWKFPQLNWIFEEDQKTLIFCPIIALEFRVKVYLWHEARSRGLNPKKLIRMYNSLNWPSYNTETLNLMHNDPYVKNLLSTDCLCVGFNCKHIRTVVIMGEEKDINTYVQKAGRPGRDCKVVKNPRAVMYITKKAESVAKEVVEGNVQGQKRDDGNKKDVEMDIGMARFLLSNCLPVHQDDEFANPLDDPPCTCETCRSKPRPSRPNPCNCSKCLPEEPPTKPKQRRTAPAIPMVKRLTDEMRSLATERLISFRMKLWRAADEIEYCVVPPVAFLPDIIVKKLLNNYALLHSAVDLDRIIKDESYLVPHRDALWQVITMFKRDFIPLREKAELDKAAAKRAKELNSQRKPG